MTRRCLFRTRGGPTQGWGNVFRLSSFATAYRDAEIGEPVFAVEGPDEVHHWLNQQGWKTVVLPEDLTVVEERALLAKAGPFDGCVAEMLDIDWARQEMLRERTGELVVFDDLCDHAYCADWVVCGQELPTYANRSLSHERTRFLAGVPYFLCRPEFLAYADLNRSHRPDLQHIFVSLGGGRYDVGYLKAALAIARSGVPVQSTFVLGYANMGRLASQIREILPTAEVLGGVSDMPARLWDTDLAIVSAGYTKLEAAVTRTPAVMFSAQWHQIPLAQAFEAATGTWHAGYMSYVEPSAVADWILRHRPGTVRNNTAARARLQVDGRGFERVIAEVFGFSSKTQATVEKPAA